MDSRKFAQIRHYMGKTQKQLADLLCVSPKAIQSFEQGWRKVPASAERQLLILLSIKSIPSESATPCWEKKNCSEEWRINCPVWELKIRHFCWLVNGTFCQGKLQKNWHKKMELCWECDVFKAMVPSII